MIDYQVLLVKYMRLIIDRESFSYVDDAEFGRVAFKPEELEELIRIEATIDP